MHTSIHHQSFYLSAVQNIFLWGLFIFAGSANAGELRAHIVDQKGKAVEDAIILATPVDPSKLARIKAKDEIIDQIDKEFVPFVKPVLVGSKVFFPNKDDVRHHVYSFSAAKTFELQLYSGKTAPPVVLDKAGIVVLGCNIHDWMLSYVYVAETPYFAKTAKDGNAAINDLPAGDYQLKVWHPSMGMTAGENGNRVNIQENGSQKLDWTIAVKPIIRIPRKTPTQNNAY